jgi:hypothetical protein
VIGRRALLLAVLAIAAAVLVTWRMPASPAPAPAARTDASTPVRPGPRSRPGEVAVEPEAIRDVFRFVERASATARPIVPSAPVAASPLPSPELPRLVGLVRRQGRLLAAFAVDGDVVLAGPGEEAAGVTVLEVSEDGVRIRRRNGALEQLTLP